MSAASPTAKEIKIGTAVVLDHVDTTGEIKVKEASALTGLDLPATQRLLTTMTGDSGPLESYSRAGTVRYRRPKVTAERNTDAIRAIASDALARWTTVTAVLDLINAADRSVTGLAKNYTKGEAQQLIDSIGVVPGTRYTFRRADVQDAPKVKPQRSDADREVYDAIADLDELIADRVGTKASGIWTDLGAAYYLKGALHALPLSAVATKLAASNHEFNALDLDPTSTALLTFKVSAAGFWLIVGDDFALLSREEMRQILHVATEHDPAMSLLRRIAAASEHVTPVSEGGEGVPFAWTEARDICQRIIGNSENVAGSINMLTQFGAVLDKVSPAPDNVLPFKNGWLYVTDGPDAEVRPYTAEFTAMFRMGPIAPPTPESVTLDDIPTFRSIVTHVVNSPGYLAVVASCSMGTYRGLRNFATPRGGAGTAKTTNTKVLHEIFGTLAVPSIHGVNRRPVTDKDTMSRIGALVGRRFAIETTIDSPPSSINGGAVKSIGAHPAIVDTAVKYVADSDALIDLWLWVDTENPRREGQQPPVDGADDAAADRIALFQSTGKIRLTPACVEWASGEDPLLPRIKAETPLILRYLLQLAHRLPADESYLNAADLIDPTTFTSPVDRLLASLRKPTVAELYAKVESADPHKVEAGSAFLIGERQWTTACDAYLPTVFGQRASLSQSRDTVESRVWSCGFLDDGYAETIDSTGNPTEARWLFIEKSANGRKWAKEFVKANNVHAKIATEMADLIRAAYVPEHAEPTAEELDEMQREAEEANA